MEMEANILHNTIWIGEHITSHDHYDLILAQ